MAIPLGGTSDITMAAEGKLLAEIERAFFLVGTLQEQAMVMDKQLTTLISKTSNPADGNKDLTLKDSAAEPEKTSLELVEKEVGGEKVQIKNFEQKFTRSGNKEEAFWIINYEKTRQRRKAKEEVAGYYGTLEVKRAKKHNWDFLLFSGLYDFEFGGSSAEPWQQVSSIRFELREDELTATDIPRDLKTNKKDYQQNRQRETERDLKASDVRNPG